VSLLLETVRGAAGSELQEHFQTLIDELDRQCTIQSQRVAPATDELPEPLRVFREALMVRHETLQLTEKTLQEILRYSPRTLEDYRLARVAEWSQARYALDKRFTRLTLLLDQGPEAQGTRWQAQQNTFDDLREVLAEAQEPALVLLGPPGCGKSTLLRRLELDLAIDALDALRAAEPEQAPLSFFVPLNRYRPTRPGEALPAPADWLAQEWAQRYPQLPALGELLQSARLVLLLDAVNELPHADEADYRERIACWRDFLNELPAGTRTIFSCRSLDYSAPLSTPAAPVTHVRIEQLGDPQVEEFLTLHDADRGPALWQQLRGTPQLDLFRSPFYLRLLLAQAGEDGTALSGKAALFTGFVRQALRREIDADNPLFRPGVLLGKRDLARIIGPQWRNAIDLPSCAPLLPALCQLAFALQARRAPGEASRVRVPYDDALELLGEQHSEDLLHAGVALQVLEVQWDDVFYVHQLLQEYFAARALAASRSPRWPPAPGAPTRYRRHSRKCWPASPIPTPARGADHRLGRNLRSRHGHGVSARRLHRRRDGGEPAARRPLRRPARRQLSRSTAQPPAAGAARPQPRPRRRPARAHRRRPGARRTRRSALHTALGVHTATSCCRRWWTVDAGELLDRQR
jgi:hypothetical protein